MLLLGGCAATRRQAAASRAVHGYADLDVLVRRHPGWAGVALYDQALMRLDNAANRASKGAPADQTLAALPSISTEPGAASTLIAAAERQRLTEVYRLQVSRLRERQSQSRARRLSLDREIWMRQAQAQFVLATRTAQDEYLQHIQKLTDDRTGHRINLSLQIKALQKIVSGWNNSIPPTPLLNQSRADLKQKQDELAALSQAQSDDASQALAVRKEAIAKAQEAREAFVSQQSGQEEAQLEAQDGQQVASLENRLSEEQVTLLHQEQSPPNAPVPAAGMLGTQTLPAGPVVLLPPAGATVRSLRASEAQMRDQRARWLAFLYDDTRAAVVDIAGQRHWSITFQRSSANATDMTGLVGQALTVSVWKSEGLS